MITRRAMVSSAVIAGLLIPGVRANAQDPQCIDSTPLAAVQPSSSAWTFTGTSDQVSDTFRLASGSVFITMTVELGKQDWDTYQLFRIELLAPDGEHITVTSGSAPYSGTRLLTINPEGEGDWRVIVVAAEAGDWSVAIEQ